MDKCDRCNKETRFLYRTNAREDLCDECCYSFPVDIANNVLIDPATLSLTMDQFLQFGEDVKMLTKDMIKLLKKEENV